MISRILIVGYGSIGKRHLRLARDLFPLAIIKVLRHKLVDDIPKLSNGCYFFVDDAQLFKPQITIIANPAPFHISIAKIFAEIGSHLLIEKPLSTNLDNLEELNQICVNKNIVLMVGYNLRFFNSLIKFRELLNQKIIGKPLSVRCEIGKYLPSWRPNDDYRLGVSAKKELGGGALLELSHELDYLCWIFGEVEWVKASLLKQSSLEINVEDTAHLILGFLRKNNSTNLVASVNLDFIRHDNTRYCKVIGEKGTLFWNAIDGKILHYKKGSSNWDQIFSNNENIDESYAAEWKDFIGSIDENKKPKVSIKDGIKVLQIIDAARKSNQTGKEVKIDKTKISL